MKTILARFGRCTEIITAEHHSEDHGMKFALIILGGKHHGIVIHCPTAHSVMRLFTEVIEARKTGVEHPYLATV